MTELEYTIKKIQSLATKKPDKEMYSYLFSFLDQWKREGLWWFKLIKSFNRWADTQRRAIYRTVLVTLGKISTPQALKRLDEFYQPKKSLDDRENIRRAVIAFLYKDHFEQNFEHIDFESNDDCLNIYIKSPKKSEVVYVKSLYHGLRLTFEILLKKIGNLWFVADIKPKK